MPQMSPMFWFIFPFIMVLLVLVGVITLNSELSVDNGVGYCSVGEEKCLLW